MSGTAPLAAPIVATPIAPTPDPTLVPPTPPVDPTALPEPAATVSAAAPATPVAPVVVATPDPSAGAQAQFTAQAAQQGLPVPAVPASAMATDPDAPLPERVEDAKATIPPAHHGLLDDLLAHIKHLEHRIDELVNGEDDHGAAA